MERVGRIKQRVSDLIGEAVDKAGHGTMLGVVRLWCRCIPAWNGAHWEVFWETALHGGGINQSRAEIYGTLTECAKRGIDMYWSDSLHCWCIDPKAPKRSSLNGSDNGA